ncbi:MAG: hypothetical protein R3183_06745 [Oleiphilaceae bacterium]|nr:hypothetical protein [Oleiphilaceae bacterium]
MAQRFAFYPVVVALLFGLSACGVIQDRSNEYLQIEESNELVVPPWYRQDQVNARYPVPEITQKRALPEKFVLPEPPDGTAALGADPYLIETIAGQTWLHLYTSPGKVWPLLDFFWREYNIRPEFENISQGYVATGELDPSSELLSSIFDGAVPSKKLRLQAKLNQGVRRNNAELQVRLVDAALPNASWQALSQYPIEETKILDAMGQFITSEQIENRYSLLANDIVGESLVRIN